MSKVESQYLDVLGDLIEKHEFQSTGDLNNINRTSMPATKQWVNMIRHDFSEGFPLLTTKKVWWRGIVSELIGFLAGITNHHDFKYIGGSVWEEWALKEDYLSYKMTDPTERLVALANALGVGLTEANERVANSIKQYGMDLGTRKIYEDHGIEYEVVDVARRAGDLGPIYGAIWRDFNGVDQIMDVITQLRINPMSRRHLVSAWKPDVLPVETETHGNNVIDGLQALPPCHLLFQYDVMLKKDGTPVLNSMFLMRSADIFLGVPFNLASYGLLTAIIADEVDFELGESVAVLNNNHLYHNAVGVATEQVNRRPKELPKLVIPAEFNLMKVLSCRVPHGKVVPEANLDILKEHVDMLVDALVDYEHCGELKAAVIA